MSGNDDERSSSSASPDKDSDYLAVIDFLGQKYTVAGERPNQDVLAMNDADYHEYTSHPIVYDCPLDDDFKLHFAHICHEFMSAACLLPSISKSIFNDPSKIRRYQYIGNKPDYDTPIWSFRAKYFHGTHVYRFNVEEIDISSKIDSVLPEIAEQKRMSQRLYILHYFKHDNLLSAYFTLLEPWIYRMNTALPNNVSLLELSNHLDVRRNNRCPSIKYVAICILRALEYLHESNIVHHAVSIDNCFYDLNGNVLLGGFEFADIVRRQFEQSYDIWDVATTLLDYCFFTNQYGIRYPDPTCINGFENLFDKMLRRQGPIPRERLAFDVAVNLNGRRMDGNNNDPETLIFNPAHHQIIHNFATQEMYGFLLRVFQRHFRPSAATLLENDEFVGVSEDDFKQLKFQMANVCQDLEIKPFCKDRTIRFRSTPHETIKPLDIWKEKSRHHFVYKTISPSVYQSYFKNPRRQFKNGSQIQVNFTIVSQIYDGNYTFNELFYVGDERSIFQALCNVIKKVDENSPKRIPQILPQNGASRWWYPLRSPRQFFFAWDIFRLRAALDAIIADVANCTCDPSGTRTRKFPLCHYKKDISRYVVIKIHYSPADIEIKK